MQFNLRQELLIHFYTAFLFFFFLSTAYYFGWLTQGIWVSITHMNSVFLLRTPSAPNQTSTFPSLLAPSPYSHHRKQSHLQT